MPELSNLLRQRLGAGESAAPLRPEAHPDADTLTAFVEQLLPSAERKGVVTHLSACALCREVVALSLPQVPELAGQAAIIPASGWRRLWTPGFRWAGALAAVAVAAALVVELPRRAPVYQSNAQFASRPQVAKADAPPAVAQPETAQPETAKDAQAPKAFAQEQLVAPKSEQASSDKFAVAGDLARRASGAATSAPPVNTRGLQQPSLKDTESRVAITATNQDMLGRVRAEEAKSQVTFSGSAAKQDYVNNDLFAANDAGATNFKFSDLPQAPAPQTGNSQLGLAASSPTQLKTFAGIPANATKKSKFHLLNPITPLQRLCEDVLCKVVDVRQLAKVTPSAPAIKPGAVSTSAMDVTGTLSSSLLHSRSAPIVAAPEKSASGELDKSEGFARAAAAPAAKYREGASAQLHWKVEEGKLFKSMDQNQWQNAYSRADANFEFSVVAAHGADVWAGGSRAALLHSRDGGAMWENVKLSDSASGTIVSIVANGLNVQVKTSDNQSWSSTDAGKTWALQSGQ